MNEIQKYEPMSATLYDGLSTIDGIQKVGTWFARSGLFGVETMEAGIVLAMACLAERKSPIHIMQTYHIVEGKLSMKADTMLARFMDAGGTVDWIQFDDKAAIADWTCNGKTTRIGFTIDEAERAELIRPKSNWIKRPAAMLRARLIGKAIRMLNPGVIANALSPEEIEDDVRSSSAPVKQLLTTPKPQAPEPTPQPKVIDVQHATVEPAKDVPIEQPKRPEPSQAAPAELPLTEPKPKITKAEKDPTTGRLTAQTQQALCDAIGEANLDAAMAWLVAKNWITADQTIGDLTELRADKILRNPEGFRNQITK